MTTMSKASQRAYFAEGLALGVLALQAPPFNPQMTTMDLAFEKAWRDWPYRDRFPQLDFGRRSELRHVLPKHAAQRSGTHYVGWISTWPFQAGIVDEWTVDEVGDLLEELCGVPQQAWVDLAGTFLRNLETRS